jgi:hypothetical protein
MYRCDFCEKVIFAETWLRRRRWNPRWLTRPRRLSVPEHTGGTHWKYQARTYRHFGWDNDDDVTNFFSPHAKGKSAIFLLAIGKPLKRTPD